MRMVDEAMRYFRVVLDDGTQQVIRRERRSEWTDEELCDVVRIAHEAFVGEGAVHCVTVADEETYLHFLASKINN